jgi:hypothetical protein
MSDARKSDMISASQNLTTESAVLATAAYPDAESEKFCRLLVGDTTSIWCADADHPVSSKEVHTTATTALTPEQHLQSSCSPLGANKTVQACLQQVGQRGADFSQSNQSSQSNKEQCSNVPQPAAQQRHAECVAQHESHLKRLGAAREALFRDRTRTAAFHGGEGAWGSASGSSTVLQTVKRGPLPQLRLVERVGGAVVSTSETEAASRDCEPLPPNMLQAAVAAATSRLHTGL